MKTGGGGSWENFGGDGVCCGFWDKKNDFFEVMWLMV
jgi:hypothetical protein